MYHRKTFITEYPMTRLIIYKCCVALCLAGIISLFLFSCT